MESMAWPAALKRTRQREVVWEILAAAEKPLDVKEIFRRINTQEASFAISTVYRALAAFEEHQMVTKTTMMGEETALYAQATQSHAHYAICLACHKQVPLKHCPFEHVSMQAETEDFTVTNHRLELYGYCKECKK